MLAFFLTQLQLGDEPDLQLKYIHYVLYNCQLYVIVLAI